MAEKNNKTTGEYCACQNCQGPMGYHHGNFFLRWFLGMMIILIVLWIGMQIGELRSYIGTDGYGGHRVMDQGYNYPYGMIRTLPAPAPSATTTPSTSKTK